MAVDATTAVQGQVRVKASRETVFGFLTEADKMTRWMGVQAQAEPVPGGIYRVVINDRDTASGEFVEVDPPRRVVFTWGWESEDASVAPGESTVEVTLEEDGDATLVRLVHSGLPTEDARERHAHGWHHYMPRLAEVAAGGDPGPDPWANTSQAGKD
jgi:uncharacterized protein YndB with AHSA1/START domain